MTERLVIDEKDRKLLIKFIEQHKIPMTVTIVDGRKRSIEQNKLNRLWMNEIASQLGDQTPEQVRAFCKLSLGVPILRAENEKFCKQYDEVVRPLPYHTKILLMMEPLDFPVTRLMTVKQKKAYLDAVHEYFTEQGLVLTQPDLQGLAA